MFSIFPTTKVHIPNQEFDYIIVGGGICGLAVENRLSKLSNIIVAIIEASGEVENNPNVTVIENFLKAIGTQIDWQYLILYISGKALGGSSTIMKGTNYVRAEQAQIDSWETIGNQGWNWESLFPYYKKSEHFDAPTTAQFAARATFLTSTFERDANVREDAARVYYYPIQNRSNLRVFLNTTDRSNSYLDARKDVIVSAASLRSPAVLELSGIGNPLYGFPFLFKRRENLQDQPNTALGVAPNTTFNGTMEYVTYSSVSYFFGNMPHLDTDSLALQVSKAVNNSVSSSALKTLFGIQYSLLSQGVPDAETAIDTTIQYDSGPSAVLSSASFVLLPFSRWNVHIGFPGPLTYPILNPNYFLAEFDLDVQIGTQPIGNARNEIYSGFAPAPAPATNQQWGECIKSAFTANYHPPGTTSMMPKESGGVVDNRLKVYGAANVLVVDASIFSF
ncbi:GMC oxidoreductase [Oidiodendron maius Zn]|uniref:GMC oxidoreductase n=1 Tax=Oidiodendron maius (strain Zn) TaxID=913774 RepID=A0A0C3DJU7_OIDMZ|nr:GMC oxidoreductase [Oidiodendron maius Zn]